MLGGTEVKIDLESLTVLEAELRERLAFQLRLYKARKGSNPRIEPWVREYLTAARLDVRIPLAGLRAIQLARRTVAAVDELEAKYGVKVSK